jgi:hypothetical protein
MTFPIVMPLLVKDYFFSLSFANWFWTMSFSQNKICGALIGEEYALCSMQRSIADTMYLYTSRRK